MKGRAALDELQTDKLHNNIDRFTVIRGEGVGNIALARERSTNLERGLSVPTLHVVRTVHKKE